MLFAITCLDKPNSLEIRQANRDAHLAHIRASNGAVVQAGPFLDNKTGNMYGSLIIFEADDIRHAHAWAENDPYQKADLFQSVEIRKWHRVVNQ